jgi:SAM-dependent methyltransferase
MKQSDAMKAWAGDNWLKRNRDDLGKSDPVSAMIETIALIKSDSNVLEIGCANGWRLKKLQEKYGCHVVGIDPSALACAEAWQHFNIPVHHTVAAALPFDDEIFDIVIMGFCMWLTEPSEWFRNVSESDRVLKDEGALIIHDFCSPRAWRRPYDYDEEAKRSGLWNYFFDWPKLWLAHPCYFKIRENFDLGTVHHESVTLLHKSLTKGIGTIA